MGGDILYRWGNPSNYGMSGQQVIPSAVHDSRWIINDGRPNGGYLQIFNNKGISNNQSTVDGIETPLDPATGYTYTRIPGQPYGPSSYTTRYICQFSSSGQSASDRMSNGNIYVNASGGQGGAGVMYEVDSLGNLVWGPYNSQSQKGFRYECDYPGIIALEPYINTNTTTCFDHTGNDNVIKDSFVIYPNPTSAKINIDMSLNNEIDIIVSNIFGQIIYQEFIKDFQYRNSIQIDLDNYPEGIYLIKLRSNSGKTYNKSISYIK